MLKLNSQAILHLSKLNRMVLRVKGVRHGIADEKGILELLKYAADNKEPAYQSIYNDFMAALSAEEKAAMEDTAQQIFGVGLLIPSSSSISSGKADSKHAPAPSSSVSSSSEPVETKTVYYRGVKKQVPINPDKSS